MTESIEQRLIEKMTAGFGSDELLWKCQVRLGFLTTLAIEEPDLAKHDSMFTGFREVLVDAKELLDLAIKKIEEKSP